MRAPKPWLLLLLLMGVAGCASGAAGRIPPAAFQFHEVVSQRGAAQAGGWKVAQTTILLTRISQRQPIQAQCDVEIGVPLVNGEGVISTLMAQTEAAASADEAARFALGARPGTSAELCNLFRAKLELLLALRLKGARVRHFVHEGVPRNVWGGE